MKDESRMRGPLEEAWRRELTPEAQAALSSGNDPKMRAELELEHALTSALRRMPDAPVSSNFTSRVTQAVELEKAATTRRRASVLPVLIRWLPRFAVGCLVAGSVFLWHGKVEARRSAEMARSVAIISAPSLTPEILADFDAIQVMSVTPAADEQLLALME